VQEEEEDRISGTMDKISSSQIVTESHGQENEWRDGVGWVQLLITWVATNKIDHLKQELRLWGNDGLES